MFRVWCIGVLLLLGSVALAQNDGWKSLPEKYVDITVATRESVNALGELYTIDKVVYNSVAGHYDVRLWLTAEQFDSFLSSGISYQEVASTKGGNDILMAWSYEEMSEWNRYPTYGTYLAMMDTFAHRYPNLCTIDTLLAQTPDYHAILAVHITLPDTSKVSKPSFFYSSSMHGDETSGFILMLRLIDYILTHYSTDDRVKQIVENVDLWICPLENPDGTYHYSNDTLGPSPISTRANYTGRDLNRIYPWIGQENVTLPPEAAAMVKFFREHQITMSAVMHGGAEVFNYPWDSWTSRERQHADRNWWLYVGRMFASLCQQNSPVGYFEDEQYGVTAGGDWYVILRGRQDYMNYFQHCREVTVEISEDKVPPSDCLPDLWSYCNSSLLSLIIESAYGIQGCVTDAVTGEPVVAQVAVQSHDDEASVVFSDATGGYHRPIEKGSFKVLYSAEGYKSKTMDVVVQNGRATVVNVALEPLAQSVAQYHQLDVRLYPNPAQNIVNLKVENSAQESLRVRLMDQQGRLLKEWQMNGNFQTFDIQEFPSGLYWMDISTVVHHTVLKLMKY